MDFKKLDIAKRTANKSGLKVTVEIELGGTDADPVDVCRYLQSAWDTNSRETANFNLFLLRAGKARTWDLKMLMVERTS